MEREDRQFELIDLVNVIWKRKWLIIIPTVACMAAAAALSYLSTPIWEVDALMLPSKSSVQTTEGAFQEFLVADPTQIVGAINQESYNASIAAELNLDLKNFPKPKAEALRDTKLVRIAVRDKDVALAKSVLQALFVRLKEELDKKIDVQMKAIDAEITYRENGIKANEIGVKDLDNQIATKRLQIVDRENGIKTKENEIKKRNNDIRLKELDVKSREIEKERVRKEIEVDQNKLKISEERVVSILEEMKSVKGRIDAIDGELKKALADRKKGGDAVGLLLYSNEIQQNLRYYNTLDEKQSTEKITQENLRLAIRDKQQQLLQLDNQISQINTTVDSINA